jgi:hypothetical protein
MQKTPKNAELVTDRPKVTDSDGLPVFNWRSLFRDVHTQQPVTIRHPSLIVENGAASTCSTDTPDATTTAPRQNRTASTCARIALAAPTRAQISDMDAITEADALDLLTRLEADGVRFLLNASPGIWRFDGAEKLCIEYERIARNDWHDVMKLRADIARIIAERRDAAADNEADSTQNDAAST